ncbi:hypothetical protein FSU_2132 [Fibrobacter succinogenes subsp. succinogenes S85]|jgi:hypothetical protein|uniref:Uncharacterized protein n=1 Tax=Fibrobacter succinogenes (strain ATCC 19169 / S85) TaxID=59374 RepID=C9RRQ2_FIBSS|nr:hypothetical protein [Fibrobacter succinogenes]ACX75238.1 hypothetical protein Fisuc_1643 [Fibrobacter succinogenes subsp. succinogenes S85]ADL25094.1 hypothetical protein FSU_2132 [Fibrobacter succinogenes subsp. succinogenes S85]
MIRSWLFVVAVLTFDLLLVSCTKHPEEDDSFKQIQLHWNAVDSDAESSEHKDNCVIEITSKVMQAPLVLKSKLVEISYEVIYSLTEKGELVFEGRCGDSRFSDLPECSWQSTCSGGSASVVKFHNER